jgi:hypothetical protein
MAGDGVVDILRNELAVQKSFDGMAVGMKGLARVGDANTAHPRVDDC